MTIFNKLPNAVGRIIKNTYPHYSDGIWVVLGIVPKGHSTEFDGSCYFAIYLSQDVYVIHEAFNPNAWEMM